jgi:hypothetical protein
VDLPPSGPDRFAPHLSGVSLSGLGLPTTALMSLGGDDRITIDERSGLNSYGCAPEPMLSVMYSSSTASSISAAAFQHVQAVHYRLRTRLAEDSAEALYTGALEKARPRLRAASGDQREALDDEIRHGPHDVGEHVAERGIGVGHRGAREGEP